MHTPKKWMALFYYPVHVHSLSTNISYILLHHITAYIPLSSHFKSIACMCSTFIWTIKNAFIFERWWWPCLKCFIKKCLKFNRKWSDPIHLNNSCPIHLLLGTLNTIHIDNNVTLFMYISTDIYVYPRFCQQLAAKYKALSGTNIQWENVCTSATRKISA